MAKRRRKSSKKKKQDSKKSESTEGGLPEGFWNQVTVILLLLLAVLVLFGSFNTGGAVAEGLFSWMRSLVGYLAYFVPALLVFAAIQKQRGEGNKIPKSTFIGLIIFICALAGLVHLFTNGDNSLATADQGRGGGQIGHGMTALLLTLFNTATGAILLLAIVIVSLHFILKIPLNAWLRLIRVDKKIKVSGESEKSSDSGKDDEEGFKLNEGVPVQRQKLSTLKKAAKNISDDEQHDALTTSSDPAWEFPSLDLLSDKQDKADAGNIEDNAENIKSTLADFNIDVEMQGANIGPKVTQFTLKPPAGVKLTKITALENNLALNLAATTIRMEAPIPGQRAVGIEVPNVKPATVRLRGIFESSEWKASKSPLSIAIGRDIAGKPVVSDLASMPHLLVAGATGSGKSVMINSMLAGLLYRNSPADLKLILVDPKQVELAPFDDLPHLLTPVIVEPEKCISALKWAVSEMDRRYKTMREDGSHRNIADYNRKNKDNPMPYIVFVIDELYDFMVAARRDMDALIARLAAKSRAVGIHLVLATQRPSVNVVTGVIKANVPARIAFTTVSQVDSRTVIDQSGAEKLLGSGDMLFLIPEYPKPRRIQGVLIDNKEVEKITHFLRDQRAPQYDDDVVSQPVSIGGGTSVGGSGDEEEDSLYEDAVKLVVENGKASTTLIQTRLRVGYARAARIMQMLEDQGVVGPADGSRPREVLISSLDEYGGSDDSRDDL